MIAIDTSILVRFVVQDDLDQARRAAEVLRAEDVFLPKSVVLETEWVLRFTYGLDRGRIAAVFRCVLGLPRFTWEDRDSVLLALALHEQGLDFADALHLASSRATESFRTFDGAFAKRAAKLGTQPPVRLA